MLVLGFIFELLLCADSPFTTLSMVFMQDLLIFAYSLRANVLESFEILLIASLILYVLNARLNIVKGVVDIGPYSLLVI